ncbi:hypothetical protein ACR8AL_14345 [Clavibacter sepedonicus]|uniref:Integral membrane protein n=1 Tax=Clavibacter sepedonicus TaxID=31964 RepID=B0RF72_CLASE|nr:MULTISPECIES: hypothetical protein [Clavibacter]MBD5382948.1 hypothetical protein [Clavibacter sp.]OQJ47782.1 hypothetical protein B5P19_05425 [Clavibacter sepedonicus]OQJ53288.1 hypothetical protein B5P20_03390 [Clavibacter sepedonicus]UUK64508.1 hypothetical protein LRE50_09355 [Clavibacter sepedonicus]CAQ02157.1 putative integral membrane protein [Clavibacter sepedonicus]
MSGRADSAPSRASRRIRLPEGTSTQPTSIGLGYLGAGSAVVCAIAIGYGLVRFALDYRIMPSPRLTATAWILLVALIAVVVVAIRALRDRMPGPLMAVFVVGLGIVVALDLVAVWPLGDVMQHATAGIAAGAAREVLAVDAALGIVLLLVFLFSDPVRPGDIAPELSAISRAVVPAAFGVTVVRGFRRLTEMELDRVLVQSTVSAPRYAVGMMASEELARLDLAAEQLLDDVANAREPLPLSPLAASTAASLATELRLHLIEGRRETWLHHAITESEFLGPDVTLSDPNALAGLLDRRQRDGLLSAVWLLLTSTERRSGVPEVSVQLALGPLRGRPPGAQPVPLRRAVVPIVVTTTGLPRTRLDPSTWDAIDKVGTHTESTRGSSLLITIDCVVDNPADR